MSVARPPGADPFTLAARLVDIPSVSHNEAVVADFVEESLRATAGESIEVVRIGDNVCARTDFGLGRRLVLAGHLDTVPANGNARAQVEDDVLRGLGAADMKSGDAVFLELARAVAGARPDELAADISWLFYVCEEVDRRHSGLLEIERSEPALISGDAAILGEPTGGLVEAGCQGVLRVAVEIEGVRAHTARPWKGVNAIHSLAPVLDALAGYEGRTPVVDGCEYREALQAVAVSGGVANNVVPDLTRLVLNHRFAPDRGVEEAFDCLRGFLEVAIARLERSGATASVVLEDSSPAAVPGLSHPLLSALVAATGRPPRAKLGWTDVAFFSERGIPAANFGPGDPNCAHTADESVRRDEVESVFAALLALVSL